MSEKATTKTRVRPAKGTLTKTHDAVKAAMQTRATASSDATGQELDQTRASGDICALCGEAEGGHKGQKFQTLDTGEKVHAGCRAAFIARTTPPSEAPEGETLPEEPALDFQLPGPVEELPQNWDQLTSEQQALYIDSLSPAQKQALMGALTNGADLSSLAGLMSPRNFKLAITYAVAGSCLSGICACHGIDVEPKSAAHHAMKCADALMRMLLEEI